MRARRMEFKLASSKLHAQLYSSPHWRMSKPVPTEVVDVVWTWNARKTRKSGDHRGGEPSQIRIL